MQTSEQTVAGRDGAERDGARQTVAGWDGAERDGARQTVAGQEGTKVPQICSALILCGGRSSRLGGVPKAGLVVEGQTLLARTVAAARQALQPPEDHSSKDHSPDRHTSKGRMPNGSAGRIAVVGPAESAAEWLGDTAQGIVLVQEDPPFSGPAAGIAAGLAALNAPAPDSPLSDVWTQDAPESGHVLVLACDMPAAVELVKALAAALAGCGPEEGVMAVDGGRAQPLAGIYPRAALQAAVDVAQGAGRLHNASVFSLLASVKTKECTVPEGLCADIDTWEDARRHGIPAPH